MQLSAQEWELLAYLTARPGQDVSVEELHREIWQLSPRVTSRAAFHAMRRLRAKIEAQPDQPRYLRTVHGVGYRFEPAAREPSLPSPPTPIFGRDASIAAVAALIEREPLVTLKGPAGVGKTRIALEIARNSPRRAVFVDLTEAASEADVAAAMAAAFAQPLAQGPAPLAERLGWMIDLAGDVLLVLDGLDDALDCALWLTSWRSVAPQARVLVTSRVLLGIRGEILVEIEPLPKRDAIAMLEGSLERRGIPKPPEDELGLGEIADAVGGLPLALELAGGWLAVASPADVVRWIETQGIDALRSFERDIPAQHACLRAAIEASWRPLDPSLQRTLAAWSVFAGPFTGAAAAAVSPQPRSALDALRALVDRSLVARRSGRDGPLFEILPSIRAFAGEHLSPEARAEARAAHAAFFAEIDPSLPSSVDCLPQLVAAADACPDPEIAARLAIRLAVLCAHVSVKEPFLALAKRLRESPLAEDTRVRLAVAEARMSMVLSDPSGALAVLQGLVASDPALDAELSFVRVECRLSAGDRDVAAEIDRLSPIDPPRAAIERARMLVYCGRPLDAIATLDADTPSEAPQIAYWQAVRGMAWSTVGDLEAAKESFEAARKLWDATGDQRRARSALLRLAEIEEALGNREKAAETYRQLLRTPGSDGALYTRVNLANLDAMLGRPERAEIDARSAIRQAERSGVHRASWFGQIALASALQHQGRLEEAFAVAKPIFDVPDPWVGVHAGLRIASIAAAMERAAEARSWLTRTTERARACNVGASSPVWREIREIEARLESP